METKKTIAKNIEITDDIICDICGKSCKTEYGFEYLDCNTTWGFESDKDMETWSAHICEKCVDEKLNFIKFKKESL